MNEFDIITRYFLPLTADRPEALGLRDDAAVMEIPAGRELVVTSDTVQEGVHFIPGAAPGNIAHKALRRALSDLAAMGADPLCYQMMLALPQAPGDDFLRPFTQTLLADQKEFGLYCSGGDTTRSAGGIAVALTVLGTVPPGRAVLRSGAQTGDHIYITGPIGDAWIGLQALRNLPAQDKNYFISKHYKPIPRIHLSTIIREYATACIDISDGLLADMQHLCQASRQGAALYFSEPPVSWQAKSLMDAGIVKLEDLLTGGDDYELIICVPPQRTEEFEKQLKEMGLNPFYIGKIHEEQGGIKLDGQYLTWKTNLGWEHF
ncbi:MAG: thiamine-phosphate kinase [Alphaproteobacteria bacterium]|nr:thiamine-phosphate kinase [Alphaproteobacteria bacterium]